MKVENLEFYEAVEFLSQKFNIPIQYDKGNKSPKELSLRKQALDIHAFATEWFHNYFIKSNEAEPVRLYWQKQRRFSLDVAKEYKIGYAPTSSGALALALEKKQFSIEACKASGLFFVNESANQFSQLKPRFRGRLMIPIRDINARVIAFTARQLEQTPEDDPSKKAKYVNSPETLLFHKSKLLFGMDRARKHLKSTPYFILVEGQLDAIRCWSLGLNTAIAPQGTAITEEQLLLLRRYEPSKIECLLDGDAAGKKAALRTLPLTFKVGLEFSYLTLPEKSDPDDLLSTNGIEALEALRTKAFGPIQLLLDSLLPDGSSSSTQEKIKASRHIFELLSYLNSEIAQEDYLQEVSKKAKISMHSLIKDYHEFKRLKARQSSFQAKSQKDGTRHKSVIIGSPLTQTQWELLYLSIKFPEYGRQIAYTIDTDSIDRKSISGKFLAKLLSEFYKTTDISSVNVNSIIETNDERQLLADIHTKELDVEEPIKMINECLRTLKKNILNEKKNLLTQKIKQTDPNDLKFIELMKKVKQINQDLIETQNLAIQ